MAGARVLGGMHFITGAAGGTIVGPPMGPIVVPLHASPVSIVPVSGDGEHGIAASATFCSVLGAFGNRAIGALDPARMCPPCERRATCKAHKPESEGIMLWGLAILFLVLWGLGLMTSYTLGGFVHILLVLAVVVVVVRVIQGRRSS